MKGAAAAERKRRENIGHFVAPDFSPLLRGALHHLQPLLLDCVKYYTVGLAGGTGLCCEHIWANQREMQSAVDFVGALRTNLS